MGAQGTHKTSFVFAAPVTETHQMSCSKASMKNLSFCRAFFNSLRLPEFLIYNISLFYCLLAIERGPLSLDCNMYIFKIKRRRKSEFMRDSCSRG